MATLNAKVYRIKGNDISTDELSLMYRKRKFVPYRIGDASGVATHLRGIILVSKEMIASLGDPDGEAITLTLT